MLVPIISLMGPTASGKSELAASLAAALNGELISVDSALIYKGFNIGAARPCHPHHLINFRDPVSPYSAAEFAKDAKLTISDIRSRSKLPILVGGSMLYFRTLIFGMSEMPGTNLEMRSKIEIEAEKKGWSTLHSELSEVDPETAKRIHPNNGQRISRALEVFRISGRTLSEWQMGVCQNNESYLCLALCPLERSTLHARIEARLNRMFEDGFVDEVRALRERNDLGPHLPAIRATGYRQIWSFLDGEITLEECRYRTLVATRQLAKRQLTWLRSWPQVIWMMTGLDGELVEIRENGGTRNYTDEHEKQEFHTELVDMVISLLQNFSAAPRT